MSIKTTIRGAKTQMLIGAREEFHAGGKAYGDWNFRGETFPLTERGTRWRPYDGHLTAEYVEKLTAAWYVNRVSYVVYSYNTPIAWFDEVDGWTVPDHKYSRSTTAHQHTVRCALNGLTYSV